MIYTIYDNRKVTYNTCQYVNKIFVWKDVQMNNSTAFWADVVVYFSVLFEIFSLYTYRH